MYLKNGDSYTVVNESTEKIIDRGKILLSTYVFTHKYLLYVSTYYVRLRQAFHVFLNLVIRN